jgi:hypothetical protein
LRRSQRVEGLAPIGLDLLDQIAIAIIDELRGLSTYCDRNQAVLGVEGLGVGQSALYAGDHITIRIVGVAFARAEGGHGMFVRNATWFTRQSPLLLFLSNLYTRYFTDKAF